MRPFMILAAAAAAFLLWPIAAAAAQSPCDFVDPFIGTRDMGHTYPGATVPFGLVQLSPDTDTLLYSYGHGYNRAVYRYCSGYQYDDSTIVGFSHTHFSGTGHSDLGDFLVMPMTGPVRLNPGTAAHPENGYRSRYDKATETASPGYYAVTLSDYGIRAELTATARAGIHRYTFPASKEAHIILDLVSGIYDYDGKVIWSSIRVTGDTLVTGFRQTRGWARNRYVYFAMVFSRPFASYGIENREDPLYKGFWRKWDEKDSFPESAGRKLRAHFDFETAEGEQIVVRVALSGTSAEGALANLRAEAPGSDFDLYRGRARALWDRELSRIRIEADRERKVNFYTAMYHAMMAPVVWSDVDGKYRGLDQEMHSAGGFTDYTIFSLWDTFRALHPLLSVVEPERTGDMISSMLAHYQQSVHHILPVWSHYANENWCMIGYHAVPVIVDAWMKGIRNFDGRLALEACVSSACYDRYDGIGDYRKLGYVPEDVSGNSASKTLEYAYDDWTVSRLAGAMGEKDLAGTFRERALGYRHLFDPVTGFMRARDSGGSWLKPFDPLSTSGQGYIEGNAWNYSLFVPHDPAGLISLLGGKQVLAAWLDSLFVMKVGDEHIAHSEDIEKTGMIGNYVHGNEPSHHIPYLYCYAGQPWKTQEKVRMIVDSMYRASPDGLCGNDDCGQMSAWYIFSCLGFYPVCPGSNQYVFGSPCVDRATIELGGGKTFEIRTEGLEPGCLYIQSVELDGRPYQKGYLRHEDLASGGTLVFRMGREPDRVRAVRDEDLPYSMSTALEGRR